MAPKVLPIAHSILDSPALRDLIAGAYDLAQPVHCELLTRGMNDVYLVRGGETTYASRVWRSGFRSEADVAYETAFLNFLDDAGIPVPAALPTRDGALYVPLRAPEGARYLSLFGWAAGAPFADNPDPDTAHRLGALFGQMHVMAKKFAPKEVRQVDSSGQLRRGLPDLQRMVAHRAGDSAWYARAVDAIANALKRLPEADAPKGPSHGDFHSFNAFIDNGEIVLLDFDNCGVDHWAADISSFTWANDYIGGVDNAINEAFVAGYESTRPMSAAERALMPLFYAAKELRFLIGFAGNVNAVGHTTLLNPDLDWFAERTRRHIGALGIL
ncbi:MAG: phosphotransferase [Alphaproteobacteria bacterium]|nr:phosphotransferase [Alphaproteobacteria bacterium]